MAGHELIPPDGHVHTEWSWDALNGSMERTCARAAELGLPSIAFTDHADFASSMLPNGDVLVPPDLDVEGYLECLAACRERFPDLKILSGVELSEPHWHTHRTADLLDLGGFDRVLGSVHNLRVGDERVVFVDHLYRDLPAPEVMRAYLAEAAAMVKESDAFAVLAHIDYPVRYWPERAGPFDPAAFEEEYREILVALAGSGRALEVNTKVPLHPRIVSWWRDAGGDSVTFGSDAHEPAALAHGFRDAAAMVEANGFRPGRHPHDRWTLR